MADMDIDLKEMEDFAKRLQEYGGTEAVLNMQKQAVNAVSSIFLRSAKSNTPVGENRKREISAAEHKRVRYSVKGEKAFYVVSDSQHMRRSWNVTPATGKPDMVSAMVVNSASYASYVNDGHRQEPGRYVPLLGKRLVASFVKGLHMNEKAVKETERKSDAMIKRVITKQMKEIYGAND